MHLLFNLPKLYFMKQSFLLLSCFIFLFIANAQNKNINDWKESKADHRLPKDANIFSSKQDETLAQVTDNGAVHTLPIVVHVITTGDAIGSADNPTNAQINAMIKSLNNSYRKKGTVFGGVDMRIQFALATKSPTCGATTGIDRVDGSVIPNYVSGGITNINYPGSADETLVKNLSRWPNTDYINIWIVNKINGSATNPGGYTYFPEHNSAAIDGTVLNASLVNGTNKTIVHELGHFFSLYHPFENQGDEISCAPNDDCTIEGDDVCDTEVELNVSCETTQNSCNGNAPFLIADTLKNYTVLNNYMGYTDCPTMFTQGQKTRARNALYAFRYGLITSQALSAPTGLSPAAACIPTAVNGLSPYYGVQKVEFNTLSVYSGTSEQDGSIYVDRTCNQSTTLTQGKSYELTITASYGNPSRIKVYIDYNNDGSFAGTGENVLSLYTDTARKKIKIPLTGVVTGVPLRMRVIADNPALPAPTSCLLHGDATNGAGQAEDYSVIIMPAAGIENNVDKENIAETLRANVYPNPARDLENIVVYSNAEKDITINFSNQSGQKLQSKKLHCNIGANYFTWNVHSFVAGIYFISFENTDQQAIKIIKE
jgi:hypothetical protein